MYRQEEKAIELGFKFLGWQPSEEEFPELKRCVDLGHNMLQGIRGWHDKCHTRSGSDVTFWCNSCKIYWKIDMS